MVHIYHHDYLYLNNNSKNNYDGQIKLDDVNNLNASCDANGQSGKDFEQNSPSFPFNPIYRAKLYFVHALSNILLLDLVLVLNIFNDWKLPLRNEKT